MSSAVAASNSNPVLSLEQYFFRVLSALMGMLCLLVWGPANLFVRHDGRAAASALVFAGIYLTCTLLARKKNLYLFRTYCATHLLMLDVGWYLGGGSMGRQELSFFALSFTAILFLHGVSRAVFLAACVIDGVTLYGIEMIAPGWARGYVTAPQRLQDHAITYVIVVLGCAWAVRFILNAYEKEHEALSISHRELQKTMSELRVLRGFLSTCAWCKRVRDENDQWVPIETYIQDRTEALFTHGACPECLRILREKGQAPTTQAVR
jgi:hypothetical protein